MEQLSQTQRQYLRKIAHDLRPLVQLGKQGLTSSLLATIDHTLNAHELIKLKFLDYQDQKQELAEQIVQELQAHLVAVVGNVAILYRYQPDPDRRTIELP